MKKSQNKLFYLSITFSTLFYLFLVKNFDYYNDDFTMLSYGNNIQEAFLQTDNWWRPLKGLFYSFFIKYFNADPYIIVSTKILIHTALTIIIYKFLNYKLDRSKSLILSLIFFYSQSGISAVIAIDTFGQLIVVFFGIISFLYVEKYRNSKNKNYLYLSHIFLIFSLLGKEIGVTFLCINFFALTFYSEINFIFKNIIKNISRQTVIKTFIFYILLILFYLFLRSYLGATWSPTDIGEGRYNLNFGINVLENFFYYFISLFNPISNFITYVIIKNFKEYFYFFLIFTLLTSFLIIYITYYIKLNIKNELLFYRSSILLLSCFPIIFLGNIGELYTYSSVFFLIYFFDIIFTKKNYIFLSIFLTLNILSSLDKINRVNNTSKIATEIRTFLIDQKKNIVENDTLYSVKLDSSYKYSYYLLPSFEYLIPQFQLLRDINKFYEIVDSRDEIKFNDKSKLIINSEIKKIKLFKFEVCHTFKSKNLNKNFCYYN